MNIETVKKYTRWALVVLLGILIVLGGLVHDKPTQERYTDETLREGDDAPEGATLPGTSGDTGSCAAAERYEEIITGIGKASRRATAGDPQTDPGRLPEYADHERQQETCSVSLPTAGSSRRITTDTDDSSGDRFAAVGIEFKITQYTAGYESTGKHPGDPLYGITYSGEKVKEGHTIAADPDVLPMGTVVQIEGLSGTYVVEDAGGAVKGQHIDIYTQDLEDAREWGVQYRRIIIVDSTK